MMNVQSRSGPGWPAINIRTVTKRRCRKVGIAGFLSANKIPVEQKCPGNRSKESIYGSYTVFRYLVGWRCSPYVVRSENQTGSSGRQGRKRFALNMSNFIFASVAESTKQQRVAEMEHPRSIWRNKCHAKYID